MPTTTADCTTKSNPFIKIIGLSLCDSPYTNQITEHNRNPDQEIRETPEIFFRTQIVIIWGKFATTLSVPTP